MLCCVTQALDINPHDISAMMGLSQAYMLGEKYRDASERLARVVEIDPKNPQAPPLLAECYLKMGMLDQVRPPAAKPQRNFMGGQLTGQT